MTRAPCHARGVRWLWVSFLIAHAAHAAPRVMPFLPTPGIAVGGIVTGGAFCDVSQRAVLRVFDGTLVSVSATGDIKKLGTIGAPSSGPMVCDRSDRVFVGANRMLVVVDGGKTTTVPVPSEIRHLRVLDDGSLGIVELNGAVSRYTTALQPLWTAGRVVSSPLELDSTGDQILTVAATKVEITDRNGRRAGPMALTAAWLDNRTVLFADRDGNVAKWSTTTPAETVTSVTVPPASEQRLRFVRTFFQRAGKRMLLQRNNDLPIAAIALDGLAKPTTLSRIPLGRRTIAAGDAPFAVVAVNDRAFVFELGRSSHAVAHERPLGTVGSLAFSPDGRSLAMMGGDRDVIIAATDRSAFRRLTTRTFIRQPLTWTADGSIFASTGIGHVRWNLDGTVETRNERTVGLTPTGGAITITRDLRVVIDRGHSEQSFTLADRTLGVAEAHVTDRYLVVRGFKRVEVYALAKGSNAPPVLRTRPHTFLRDAALVGEASVMFLDESGGLFLADAKGERELARIASASTFAVSADHRRVAIANRDVISIWDAQGQHVAEITATASVIAVAWSPDLRTLAVATRDGVELWTIPTDERR